MWYIGVTLSIIACLLSNIGINLQKYAHNITNTVIKKLSIDIKNDNDITMNDNTKTSDLNKESSTEFNKELNTEFNKELNTDMSISTSFYLQPVWLIGILSLICGALCDLASFSYAPQSLLAPLGSLTLVFNMYIASYFLNENLTIRDVMLTLLIVSGTIVAVIFGAKSEIAEFKISVLLQFYNEIIFITYISIYLSIMISLMILLYRIRDDIGYKRTRSVCFPLLSGMFGSLSVLFSKSFSEIFKTTIEDHDNQFTHFFTYLMIFGLIFCTISQIRLLNYALSEADALFVVPIYQSSWVIFDICMGMIYFQEYKDLTTEDFLIFSAGVLIILLAAISLSSRSVMTLNDNDEIKEKNDSNTRTHHIFSEISSYVLLKEDENERVN